MSDKSIFEELSEERKALQAAGDLPHWMTTLGWQMFKGKYLYGCRTFEEQIDRIVTTVGKYAPTNAPYLMKRWKECIMDNHAYLATPVLSNTGTDRGMSVSCSGSKIPDSVDGFYSSLHEAALLSKNAFGTSAYFGDIRPRGTPIKGGGTADGSLPVFQDFVTMAQKVSQGNNRRGAFAGYLPVAHGDFWEWADYVKNHPEGVNVGWNWYDKDIAALNTGEEEINKRFQRTCLSKAFTGRGYLYKPDCVARQAPQMYKDLGLGSKASNLCVEIALHADEAHTYTCVISGMVAETWDEWKDTDAAQVMTIFLDCLVSMFLEEAKGVLGFEKAIRGTEKGRAIGLGLTGLHSLEQSKMLPFGSFEAHMLSTEIARHLSEESLKASQWMAKLWGEPEWCKGYGVRNTHRTAYAPNVSSSVIFGSGSQGITPWYGNAYNEGSAAGGLFRINPLFVELLKKYDKYTDEIISSVTQNQGSCQHLEFLTDLEREVFKTAFEIDQEAIIRKASARQRWNCQGQSLNNFFAADEDEAYIAHITQLILEDEYVTASYYNRSQSGVQASTGGCEACAS